MRNTDDGRYNVEAMLGRISTDRAELFLGFVPWQEDCEGWTRSMRELRPESAECSMTRTIWDDPADRNARVLIDVYECHSVADAVRSLVQMLQGDQLALVPEGPPGIGDVAFMHPPGSSPAVFFVRGNLCLRMASFGRQVVPIAPWAERIDSRLRDRPSSAQSLDFLSGGEQGAKAGEALVLTYELPWRLAEDGYLKIFVEGGTLERANGTLIARAVQPGQIELEAIIAEAGRPSLSFHRSYRIY